MVQDFTNVGIQPKPEESDLLAEAVRTGKYPCVSSSRPEYEVAKQKEDVPFFLDAPSKFLRQITNGGFELLELLKYGIAFVVFLIPSVLGGYVLIFGRFELDIFIVTSVCIAISTYLALKTLRAVKNIRIIAKA